ncbi:glycosyltransferase family 2 protein [Patescibacteria group bacterium]|nr:glycosyltransferase family 2 protein [Patescibacteria group bacterium]MBU1953969.1 glycosyltransferase family 2 protein [Patescibacteria group bacterium]
MISIIIINYNTRHLLKPCLESLMAQGEKDREIIVIDNNSTDGSCAYMRENFPKLTIICNGENTGYSRAANQGIKLAKGEYVMIMNADIKFEPDYIKKCLAKMREDEKIAAICGKIYRYDFENDRKTKIIDTVGLFCFKNRRVIDDGQGLEDKGQFDEEKEVFGVSGACPIYRRSALEDTKIGNEYLDEDFFMYKEDIDLSWRMRLFGWKCYYLPQAVACHGRGTGVLKKFTHHEVLKNRRKLNKMQKYYSYKNQRLMQIKNEFMSGFLRDLFPIVWKEILILIYIILREPYLFKSWLQMISQVPGALKKRRYIVRHRKVSSREMNRWLRGKQSKYLQYDLENTNDLESSRL